MKNTLSLSIITLIFLFCIAGSEKAKSQPQKSHKFYRIWLTRMSDSMVVKGILYDVKDSALIVIESGISALRSNGKAVIIGYPVSDIKSIKLRRGRTFFRNFALGTAAGLVVGAFIGIDSETNDKQDFLDDLKLTTSEKIFGMAGVMLVPGMILGAVSGLNKDEIHIDGNYASYLNNKEELKKMAYYQEHFLLRIMENGK
jgi:hypothetical protein